MTQTDVSTETDEPQAAAEPALDDAQADAAFASGFPPLTESPTGEPPSPVDAAPPAESDAPAPSPEPSGEPPPAAPTPRALDDAQIQKILDSAAKVDALHTTLEQSFGTAFGKIGGLERTLKALQEATPSGTALEVSADDFPELQKDFPELAEMLVKGLNRAPAKLKGTGGSPVPTDAITAVVAEQIQKVREESAIEVMDALEPDWRDTVNSQPYLAWLATQPAAYQDTVRTSWKPAVLRGSTQQFKAHQAAQAAPPPKPARDPRRDRLEAAVVPRGTAGAATAATDDQAFLDGFHGR